MKTSIARVSTAHASRYLQQVCKHWSHRFEARFDANEGRVDFGDSAVDLAASETELTIRVSGEADQLDGLEAVVAEHINRFAHREGELSYAWERA